MLKPILLSSAIFFAGCTGLGLDETTGQSSGSGSGSGSTCTSSGAACQADADCPSNEECDDGACKLHGDGTQCSEDEGADDDAPQGTECSVDADCGALECEDGFCVPHGGGH